MAPRGRPGSRVAATLPRSGDRVAAVGCGTSLFVSQAYAALREAAGEGETDAFAASEAPAGRIYDVVMAISRSGTTTEVARLLERPWEGARSVAICGVDDTPVANAADDRIILGFADERSVVQTRFATGALALLRAGLGEDLEPIADDGERAIAADLPLDIGAFDHFVFLGRGWTVGLANEAALKMREASGAWAESYPAMEYRHGPISVAGSRSAVWPLGDVEPDLLNDVARDRSDDRRSRPGCRRSHGRAHPGPADGGGARRGARDGSGSSAAPDPFCGALVNMEKGES